MGSFLEGLVRFGRRLFGGPMASIIKPYRWALPVVAVLGLLASLLEGIGIGLLIPLVAVLLVNPEASVPGPAGALLSIGSDLAPETRLLMVSLALVGFMIFKGVVQSANNIFIADLDSRIGRDIRNRLCARVLALDYQFFVRNRAERLAQIISTDCWNAAEAIRQGMMIIPAAIALAVFGLLLLWIEWKLAVVIVIGAVVIQAALLALERRQRRYGEAMAIDNHALGERMLSVLAAMRLIRVFGQQERELARFADASERTRLSLKAIRQLSASATQIIDVLVSVLFVVVLLVGYRFAGVSVPGLIAFLVLLVRAQPHAQIISRARIEIAAQSGSVREVEWLLSQEPSPLSLAGTQPVRKIDRQIRFDGVSYRYGAKAQAVSDLDLTIRPGVATALIGKSGSGKTTLVNLLCRLVEPSTGTIFHGEEPLAEFQPEQWRARIAIAGQDVELTDGTVFENIVYGTPGATRAEAEEAARIAGAAEFIEALQDGYNTRFGIGALELSGGQRQRIGLARALVRRPDLLILDEAINAVDSISEAEIISLLTDRRYFDTALVISHRKSTLAVCEDAIVLDRGRLVEAGPLRDSTYYRGMA